MLSIPFVRDITQILDLKFLDVRDNYKPHLHKLPISKDLENTIKTCNIYRGRTRTWRMEERVCTTHTLTWWCAATTVARGWKWSAALRDDSGDLFPAAKWRRWSASSSLRWSITIGLQKVMVAERQSEWERLDGGSAIYIREENNRTWWIWSDGHS